MESWMQLFSDPDFSNQLLKTAGIIFGGSFLFTLIAGLTNKVVIYFDLKDFFVSLFTLGIWILAFFALSFLEKENQGNTLNAMQWLTIIVSGCISLSCGFYSFQSAIVHNRSVLIGLFIGLVKILAAFIGSLVILGKVGDLFDDDSNHKDVIVTVIVLGFFMWIGRQLINGEQVYEAKGWDLPESTG